MIETKLKNSLSYIRLLFCLILGSASCLTFVRAETLSVYTWRGQDVGIWEEINKQGLIPGITIELNTADRDSYNAMISLQIQNGSADLFMWPAGAVNLGKLIEHNFIEPYTGDLSSLNPSSLMAGKGADGYNYGIPFAVQLQSMMVNKELLAEHGINEEPRNINDMESAFRKLKSAGITPVYITGSAGWYLAQIVSEVMVSGLVDDKFAKQLVEGQVCFTDKKYQLVFDTLKSWLQEGYINGDAMETDYSVLVKYVALKNAGMTIDGAWTTSWYYNVVPDYKFDFWSVGGQAGKVYAHGDGTFQVAATSEKLESAKRVLEFTKTQKFAELWVEFVGEIPAYGGQMNLPDGVVKQMTEILSQKSYAGNLFSAYDINKGNPSYNALVTEAIQGVIKGNKTPKQAVADIQAGLNSWQYIGHQKCSS